MGVNRAPKPYHHKYRNNQVNHASFFEKKYLRFF